jgi:geranylgeranyl pyrophosphate synthase
LPAIVTSEDIRGLIRRLPEVSAWTDLITVFDRAGGAPHPDWQLPVISCQAAGGKADAALPAAAAVACLQISIMLADDMLDDDPRGEHIRRGHGETANLALAFQAAAFRLIDEASISEIQKRDVASTLARSALATSYGQQLDNLSLPGEENYWQVVREKSTPFYGAAYRTGAIFANAPEETAQGLYEFGVTIGEIIQIEDDLEDAFEKPANPDWKRQGNNLLIIYAMNAEYEERDEFLALLGTIDGKQIDGLIQAQQILIESGAVSYAAYHLVQRYRHAWEILDSLSLPAPEPIADILNDYGHTLTELLSLSGVEVDMLSLRTDPITSSVFSGGLS